jgi:hypothetical protein
MTIALSLLPQMASAQVPDDQGDVRRGVILNATDPNLPAFLVLDGAIRDAIRAEREAPAELYAETLDMHRFPRTLLDQDAVAMLRTKYHDLKVDVVVAFAPIALDFTQRHREEIWPGAAIVFHTVTDTTLEGMDLDPGTVGVPMRLAFGQTIELALQLRPATRRVAVVVGSSEPDHPLRQPQAEPRRQRVCHGEHPPQS